MPTEELESDRTDLIGKTMSGCEASFTFLLHVQEEEGGPEQCDAVSRQGCVRGVVHLEVEGEHCGRRKHLHLRTARVEVHVRLVVAARTGVEPVDRIAGVFQGLTGSRAN